MPRIFIAINLPEEIKNELAKVEKEIQQLFPEETGFSEGRGLIRWVKKENLHLTLLFIGSVPDGQIPQICQMLEKISREHKPFSLRFKRVCYGPPQKTPPRLIWLEIDKNPQLSEVAANLKNEAANLGILRKIEERSFSPHITLGRIRTWQWKRIEPEERPEIEREPSWEFEVKSIEVMESVLKRTGAEYNILKSYNL